MRLPGFPSSGFLLNSAWPAPDPPAAAERRGRGRCAPPPQIAPHCAPARFDSNIQDKQSTFMMCRAQIDAFLIKKHATGGNCIKLITIASAFALRSKGIKEHVQTRRLPPALKAT
jgi:hypothetical protein